MTLAWRSDGPDGAPPLVLLSAVGSTSDMWTPCIAPLAEHFRVIRIDTRGHGRSAPVTEPYGLDDLGADVLATFDELGLGRVALAGLSLGGMVGMWIAAHHPERVGRLALLCTSAYPVPLEIWRDRATTVRAEGTMAIAEAGAARWVRPEFAGRDPALMARLRAMIASVDDTTYARLADAIAELDLRDDLARIAAPTLVVGTRQDIALPLAQQEEIAAGIPGARLAVVEDAGHVPTFEQPARVAALLLEHFSGAGTLDAGFAARRAVLGDAYLDAAITGTTELTADFQNFLTRYAWGEVWTRPDLSRRERSIATLTALTTLGAEHELRAHVRGALRNGLTPPEVIEVLMHTAVYAGLPRANRAVAVAAEVLTDVRTEEAP